MQILATVRPEAFDASGALFVPLAPSHSGSDPVYTATTLGTSGVLFASNGASQPLCTYAQPNLEKK